MRVIEHRLAGMVFSFVMRASCEETDTDRASTMVTWGTATGWGAGSHLLIGIGWSGS